MAIGIAQKKQQSFISIILHGYRTQQFQNFAIPPTWLSYSYEPWC